MLRAEYDLLMALARLATRDERGSRFDVTMRLSEVFEAARALEEKMVGRPFDDDSPVKAASAGNGNMMLRPSCFGHPGSANPSRGMMPCPSCIHRVDCETKRPVQAPIASLYRTARGEVINVEAVVQERNALLDERDSLKESVKQLLRENEILRRLWAGARGDSIKSKE